MPYQIHLLVLTAVIIGVIFGQTSDPNGTHNLIIVIQTQPTTYHEDLARDLMQDVDNQLENYGTNINIQFQRINELDDPGSWTFFPIMKRLNSKYNKEYDWILFAEPRTRVNITNLKEVMEDNNSTEKVWLGHALFDREPSIIHHFAFYENPEFFKYPNLATGFLVSQALCKHVAKMMNEEIKIPDFSIDAGHELALFIWNSDNKLTFLNEDTFCITKSEQCSTYVLPFTKCNKYKKSSPNILIAVKTCKMYHQDRITVIKKTWQKYTKNVLYFSEELDENIPTVKLNVTNVDKGHCEKTKEIVKYLARHLKDNSDVEWIALVDDDTILSISHLHEYLTCFDPKEAMVFGQRYGYSVINNLYDEGFNYITGGGGIIFNRQVLESLSQPGGCDCPNPTTPDDMYIFGVCLARFNWPIVHCSGFHQARPADYAPECLLDEHIISFHKHWMVDPIQLYSDWFEEHDFLWYKRQNNGTKNKQLLKDEF